MNRTSPLCSPRAAWIFALALGMAACASGSGGSTGGGSADTITQQQIDEGGFATALEVIQRFRPRWLRPTRSPTSSAVRPITGRPGMPQTGGDAVLDDVYPKVVLNGVPSGEIASLSSISAQSVASIRFVSAADAGTRYGSGYEGGVIELRSR